MKDLVSKETVKMHQWGSETKIIKLFDSTVRGKKIKKLMFQTLAFQIKT